MRLLAVDDPQYPDSIDVRIGVNFRSQKSFFQAEGSCGGLHGDDGKSISTARCGVACDGGSIDVTLETKGSVLVGIPDGARMWDPNEAGSPPDTTVSRKFGKDDKVFRLERTALAECMPLASDASERKRLKSGK